jgi:hypothetical protein
MTPHALQYGFRSKVNARRVIRRWLLVIGLLAAGAWPVQRGWERLYYYERDSVRSTLSSIPHASFVSDAGCDDTGSWRIGEAQVSLDVSNSRTSKFRHPYGKVCTYLIRAWKGIGSQPWRLR